MKKAETLIASTAGQWQLTETRQAKPLAQGLAHNECLALLFPLIVWQKGKLLELIAGNNGPEIHIVSGYDNKASLGQRKKKLPKVEYPALRRHGAGMGAGGFREIG